MCCRFTNYKLIFKYLKITGELMNRWVLRKSRPNTAINVGQELLSLLHGNTYGEELESRM
jgi:hypothetical protein